MPSCHACGAEFGADASVGRRAACLRCGADLRCCANCRFYAPGLHGDCAETQAERVLDKRRANFCEYFTVRAVGAAAAPSSRAARAQLDGLFKKRDP